MFIEELQQHVAIGSKEEAIALSRIDRGFWNVISIHGVDEPRASLSHAQRVHHACFDDIEIDRPGSNLHAATSEDVAQALGFADSIGRGALLIHCRLGLSRSPALALAWICRRIAAHENVADAAVDVLLRLQLKAMPNLLILRLGLGQFLQKPEAAALALALVEHPRLRANRGRQQQGGL